ncbi:6201_t:CDS:2 [Diversispora eburnea]|uniref:6201_t:CDS:1 n=1 Tax=Diversispora eburnea TaxID=1213867 RepID=A0A9N9CJL8_9GLOM|nr:6201_t:CDS:2 [Diversispora eburnea]
MNKTLTIELVDGRKQETNQEALLNNPEIGDYRAKCIKAQVINLNQPECNSVFITRQQFMRIPSNEKLFSLYPTEEKTFNGK